MSAALARIQRRWDAIALDQLRAEAARLAAENDELRERLVMAEDNAEFWGREATDMHLRLCELHVGTPGITRGGHLVVAHA